MFRKPCYQTFLNFLTQKQGFLTQKQGFFDSKQEIISKLFSKLFSRNFCEFKKPLISEKFLNFEKQTFLRFAKTKSLEISI